jgi:hypothetical protein
MAPETEGLNEHHKRRLSVTCRHVDNLLADVEAVLWASASKSPFAKYIPDIPAAQRRIIERHIAGIRARLVRTLEKHGVRIEPPSIPARRAVHANLAFVEIAVEELRPRHMRGYGEVPPAAAAALNNIVQELESLVSQLDRFIQTGAGTDLHERLEGLDDEGADPRR